MEAALHRPFSPVLPDPVPAVGPSEALSFVPTAPPLPVVSVQHPSAPALADGASAPVEGKSQFYQHFVEGDEDNDDEGETRCICGETPDDHDGIMIQCEDCHCWQHGICVGIPDIDSCPERYYCETCKPEQHPYKLPSKPKARNRRNGNQATLSSASSSTTNGPRKRRSPSDDQDASTATEHGDSLGVARLKSRTGNPAPARKRSQRRGSSSKGAENVSPANSPAPVAPSASDGPDMAQLPVPGSGSTSQGVARRKSNSKSPKMSPPPSGIAVQTAEVSEVLPMADIAESPVTLATPEQGSQTGPTPKEVCAGSKRKVWSVSSSPVKEGNNLMVQAGQNDESSVAAPIPTSATSAAPATKRRRLTRMAVVRTEGEDIGVVVSVSDSVSKEEEINPTSAAPGLSKRPRASLRPNSSEAVPVAETAISSAGRGRGGRGRMGKRGSPAKRGGRTSSSVANQSMMPPAISIPMPVGGRWRGTAKCTSAASNRSSSVAASPASATALAAISGHPYYRFLGELVKARARPRNPHSRTSLSEMNRRAKLMLDWITRMQVERAEKLAQREREEKEEAVQARQLEQIKVVGDSPRTGELAFGPALLLPSQQPALPAALDPRITPPLALADAALARNVASGADSFASAALDAPSSLAAAMKVSSERALELMDNLSRDVIKFQKRFPVKGRGG